MEKMMTSKILYLLRGIPGSGKSTWIESNKLEPYVISSDKLRMLFPFYTDEKGSVRISQMYDTKVWKLLYELLEERMKWGQPIIVDATHYKNSYIKPYFEYTEKYGYEIKIVDFTDVATDDAKKRNAERDSLKRVPEAVIDRMAEAIKSNNAEIRKNYTCLSPKDAFEDFMYALGEYCHPEPLTDEEVDDVLGLLKGYSLMIDTSHASEIFAEVVKYFPELAIMVNYDQNSKYHNYTLDIHTLETIKNIDFEPNNYALYLGALFHDIGKPIVKTVGKDGYNHFFGHADVGYELVKSRIIPKLSMTTRLSTRDLWFIPYLVKHHDDTFDGTFFETQYKEGIISEKEAKDLLRLMRADSMAHNQIGKVLERTDLSQKLLLSKV